MKIIIFELVVGDIVHLAVGDQVNDFSFSFCCGDFSYIIYAFE